MLTLAIVMLVKPELMSDIGQSLIVFGMAFAVTILILLLHGLILPKLGFTSAQNIQKNQCKKKTQVMSYMNLLE